MKMPYELRANDTNDLLGHLHMEFPRGPNWVELYTSDGKPHYSADLSKCSQKIKVIRCGIDRVRKIVWIADPDDAPGTGSFVSLERRANANQRPTAVGL